MCSIAHSTGKPLGFLDDLECCILNLSPAIRNVKFWFLYVYGICLWTGSTRQLHNFLQSILEIKGNKSLNFLDLPISHVTPKFAFNIFRKPTYTDKIIPHDSSHPYSQTMFTFHSKNKRALFIPLSPQNLQSEILTIKTIAANNGYSKKKSTTFIRKPSQY